MSKAVGDVTPTYWFSGIATQGYIWWRGFVPDRDDSFDRCGLRDINSRSGIKCDCWPHESKSFPYGFTRRAHRRWGAGPRRAPGPQGPWPDAGCTGWPTRHRYALDRKSVV